VEFTLPPEEARALFEKVAAFWKTRHEVNLSDENGEEIYPQPSGYNAGRTMMDYSPLASLQYYLPNYDSPVMRLELEYDPKTGAMGFYHYYGRSSS
jgi:hypothetical protein